MLPFIVLISVLFSFLWQEPAEAALDKHGFKKIEAADLDEAANLINSFNGNYASHQHIGNNYNHNFYIFVSFALGDEMLKQLLHLAQKYDGKLVMRGFKDNNFKVTAKAIENLVKDDNASGILIDPTLFKTFAITAVPSYVLAGKHNCMPNTSCKVEYDKITGNVSPKFALEKFAESGDLQQEATALLSGKL